MQRAVSMETSKRSTAWWLALALAGCATRASLPPPSDAPRAVSASADRAVWVTARPPTPTPPRAAGGNARQGLVVTSSACWYPVGPDSSPADKLPKIESRQCQTVSERVFVDGATDADKLRRIQALTIEDVAVKLEALSAFEAESDAHE